MTSRLRWRIRMRTDGAHSRSDGTAPYRRIGWTVVRVLATTTILVIAYYLLPLDRAANWGAVTMLVVGLLALIVLIGFQVRTIIRSPFPNLRAVESLATSLPLFLLLFAAITAKTETARQVVTGQMIADLLILGVGIKIILGAASRGQQRRRQERQD